ncbi:MAG: alpha/beta hydrolase [Gammaproteobacteria bacterium]|nr:alpha/beta hydrolase [Gammaproteobacteria bacterium]
MTRFDGGRHRGLFWKTLAAGALLAVASATTPLPTANAEPRYHVVPGHGGVPLNVVSAGDPANETLLLIHGIGQSHVSFEEQLMPPLTDEFHVVSFDLRGHGNSGKPWEAAAYMESTNWAGDVQAIIDSLALDRPVLMGWSYGTLVVADYLRHYGSVNLSGIVLTGGYGGLTPPPPPPDPEMAALFARNRALQLSADPGENAAAARAVAALLTSHDMGETWRQRASHIAMMLPAYARTHMLDRSFENTHLIAAIRVPLLLVVGGKDGSMPEVPGRQLAAQLQAQGAYVTVSVYPESGHSPFAEEPERFNRELALFAREAFDSPALDLR